MKKTLTILLLVLLTFSFGYAQNQWSFVSYFPAPNPAANSISVVDANNLWVCCDATGGAARIYKSTNGGTTWTLANTGLPAVNLYGLSALDINTCFVGDVNGDLWKTVNGGSTWTKVLDLTGSFCNGVHMFNSTYGVYIGDPTGSGQPYQFRVTNDGGNTWNLAPTAPVAGNEFGVINAWDCTDTNHFWMGSANLQASATTAKLYKTSTGFFGTFSFANVSGNGGTAGLYYQAVAFTDNNNGIIGSNGSNLRKTTDGGVTWSTVTNPVTPTTFAAINFNGLKDASNIIRIAISGDSTQMWRTTNLGTVWVKEQLPIQATSTQVQHIRFLNANLGYAVLGGTLGGLIKYGPVTGVVNNTGNVPSDYNLSQNYPNPFNPATRISFAIPKSGFVTIKVYNSLGKEVETLVNSDYAAGTYEVVYTPENITSGMYFYRITANGFTDTKKMMLVK